MTASLKTDFVAGITTFLTMSYIMAVNPGILSAAGIPFSGVVTATALLAFSMTLFMGLYAKLPYGVAPGMGINSFFAFSLIIGKKIPWPIALGLVFWAGVLFLILSLLPVRARIAQAIPKELRSAAAVGIGIFLTFIGLKNMGLIAADPATFVHIGRLNEGILWTLFSFVLIIFFLKRKNPFAFLVGISFVTVVFWLRGWVRAPESFVSYPDFTSVFFKLDIMGALNLAFLPAIVSICFTDLFDSISTFVGISQATGLVDKKGDPLRLKEGLIVDAWATLVAGLLGTSSGTAYIESGAGIEAGGRTGRSAVITAFCFLPCLFIAPLMQMIPPQATAPILILVGALMFRHGLIAPKGDWEEFLPYYLTIVLIPLTFSITQGILWGFLSYVVLHILAGKASKIDRIMYGISGLSAVLLLVENLA